jgi:hypothetical protein
LGKSLDRAKPEPGLARNMAWPPRSRSSKVRIIKTD